MREDARSTFPVSNFVWFVILSFVILVGYSLVMQRFNPPPAHQAANAPEQQQKKDKDKPAPKAKAEAEKAKPGEKPEVKPSEAKPDAKPEAKEKPAPVALKKVPQQWLAIGSADPDPKNPYRMLVTLTNQGAALARIELSSTRYRDYEDRTGYLGHLVMKDDGIALGSPVQVVGPGTPAAKAGLKAGDRIMALDGRGVDGEAGLEDLLAKKKPEQTVELTVLRDGKKLTLTAELIRRPLEIVRPELTTPHVFAAGRRHFDSVHPDENDPLSLLGTLQQIDDDKIPEDDDLNAVKLDRELKGLDLRTANWTIVEADGSHAVFRYTVPGRGLEITKTYRLTETPEELLGRSDAKSYDLQFEIEVRNTDDKAHTVAYRLDGPNGLPREGDWYASKVGRNWGAAGLRDIVYQQVVGGVSQVNCSELADQGGVPVGGTQPLRFIGVDGQYFSVVMTPDGEETALADIERAFALRIGDVDIERKTITNTSFRLISRAVTLEPGKELKNRYTVFAGPKRPRLLDEYGLGGMLYYGWYGWVAVPMTNTLHFFHDVVRNYGLAIILLTVLVRLCMFPLSRKQAQSAQIMQKLQPEIKKLQEKYKKDVEARTRAQQELFRKHNYNPLGGCLVLFIQLPIFIGLYRSLQVDVELRDAPLLSEAIRWCSNLAGPDMLYDWSRFMPDWFNAGVGVMALGPYFNLLPMLTIVLFIVQQKMFMPPPTDEQTAMQQKMMNFMMIFMGVMFYKVASGLCLYFIASSLWGIAERKFLPKATAAGDSESEESEKWSSGGRSGRDGSARKKNKRDKR